MKEYLLTFIFLFFLISCAPQVTVTSEVTVTLLPPATNTPTPTPTLHPQFIALQDKIAASGERFALMPDGTIRDNGIPISGLSVDKNGVMTLEVGDQIITLSSADVSFGDTGIAIKDYTFNEETGVWEVALTPEQQVAIDATSADLVKMGLDLANYDVQVTEDRGVVCTDKTTLAEVCVGGKFTL